MKKSFGVDNINTLKVDYVYQAMKDRILKGEYLAGNHLVESEMIEEFKVSRTTVREALRRLLNDELAELVPHKGIRVRTINFQDVMDLYLVREYIEGLSARLIAEYVDQNVLQQLKEVVQIGRAAVEQKNYELARKSNAQFHSLIADNSGNRYLRNSHQRLHSQLVYSQYVRRAIIADIGLAQTQHEEIYQAILEGNGVKAENAMRNHINHAKQVIIDFAK
ncbi:MAG: GntR family transcriptional regulator [Synergistaceae bacterium]|nr:GntR family transcriptional regulator [Synergistaceae bacterium]